MGNPAIFLGTFPPPFRKPPEFMNLLMIYFFSGPGPVELFLPLNSSDSSHICVIYFRRFNTRFLPSFFRLVARDCLTPSTSQMSAGTIRLPPGHTTTPSRTSRMYADCAQPK
jgi:hypothetical protein